jgi:hypothetical protein
VGIERTTTDEMCTGNTVCLRKRLQVDVYRLAFVRVLAFEIIVQYEEKQKWVRTKIERRG